MGLFAEEARNYYITFESDTVYVTFIGMWGGEPDIKNINWQVRLSNKNKEKVYLSPKEAKEIYFTLKSGKSFRMISVLNTIRLVSPWDLSGLRFFASVDYDSEKIKIIRFYTYNGAQPLPANGYKTELLFFKNDNSLLKLGYLGERKRMRKFFSDCLILSKMINEKNIELSSYQKVAEFYNNQCE